MSEKLLSDGELKDMLLELADEVDEKVQDIVRRAVDNFYSADIGGHDSPETLNNINYLEYARYDRTGDFEKLADVVSDLSYRDGILTLTYTFESSTVGVNEWDSPWGTHYPGSSDWAFDTGFVHGYHGGPRPIGFGKWSWDNVSKSDAIFDLITNDIESMSL